VPTRRLAVEAVFVAALILSAAALAWRLPFAPEPRVAEWSAQAGLGLTARGSLEPAIAGSNRAQVQLASVDGEPLSGAQVEMTLLPLGGAGAVVARRTLSETGPGEYAAGGFGLTHAGRWQMLVTVQRAGADPAFAVVDWELGVDGALRRSDEAAPWMTPLAGWLNANGRWALSGAALALAAGWSWRAWRVVPPASKRFAWWWLAPAGLLLALAGFVLAWLNVS
jgi:hypothetical protein